MNLIRRQQPITQDFGVLKSFSGNKFQHLKMETSFWLEQFFIEWIILNSDNYKYKDFLLMLCHIISKTYVHSQIELIFQFFTPSDIQMLLLIRAQINK